MTTIAVPVDGTVFSETALPAAATLAAGLKGTVALLTVGSPGVDPLRDEYYLKTLADRLPVPSRWEPAYATDGIADAFLGALKEAGDPDTIICMASHGRTRARLVLRSVSEGIVRRSTYPVVLVGPMAQSPTFIRRVVVCLDGSSTAERVLPSAAELARRLGATVELLYVMDRPHNGAAMSDYLRATAHQLNGLRVHTAVHTAHGAGPARVIAEHAAETGAGLLAVATHGRTGASRVMLGSVAQGVVHSAPCPVLVVTAPD